MKTLNQYIELNPEEFRQEELILETTELISRVMAQNGINKARLASKLRKSKAHISQCLSGEQNFTLRTLADVFGALGYRLELGATPIDHTASKVVPRLYPIGGWSFEQACSARSHGVIDCAATEDDFDDVLEEAAA